MTISQPLALRGDEWVCPGMTPSGPCEGMITVHDEPAVHTDPRNPADDGAQVMVPAAAIVHKDGCSVLSEIAASGRV